MGAGGFNYSPQYFGDSSNSVAEIFLNSLNQGDGDALSDEVDSFNYAENFASARVLADLWSDNTRLSYQFDPHRMTDFLSRWESILNIVPNPNDTAHARRQMVAMKLSNYGKTPTQQVISDLLTLILKDVFVSIIHNDPDTAAFPLGGIPGGAVIPGGATLDDDVWHSAIAYIAILVNQPNGMSDNNFYKAVGNIDSNLEGLLPVWTTFNWVRNNSFGTAGFILDDEHNLDNEYFD
jgi:hypothetical protein